LFDDVQNLGLPGVGATGQDVEVLEAVAAAQEAGPEGEEELHDGAVREGLREHAFDVLDAGVVGVVVAERVRRTLHHHVGRAAVPELHGVQIQHAVGEGEDVLIHGVHLEVEVLVPEAVAQQLDDVLEVPEVAELAVQLDDREAARHQVVPARQVPEVGNVADVGRSVPRTAAPWLRLRLRRGRGRRPRVDRRRCRHGFRPVQHVRVAVRHLLRAPRRRLVRPERRLGGRGVRLAS
jgi:hypothetical protein